MNTVAVLIGGPCDGRRVAIQFGVRTLRCAEPPRTAARSMVDAEQDSSYVREITYIEFWGAPGIVCMCPEGMLQANAMRALLEGYRHEIQGGRLP